MLQAIDTLSLTAFGCFYPAGLEWEDDFPAMEKSCHFRCARQTASQPHTLTLPKQSCTALSRRLFLPQTCLFLTHVTESDLDLWDKACVAHTQWAGCWFLWHRGGSLSFMSPALSQRLSRCHHGLVWHPHLFFFQTAGLGLMEKLTNRPDLVLLTSKLISPPLSSFTMNHGF